jgi:Leucine Rich repeat
MPVLDPPPEFLQRMHDAALPLDPIEQDRALHSLYSQLRGPPWEQLASFTERELARSGHPVDSYWERLEPDSAQAELERLTLEVRACYPEAEELGLQVEFGIHPFLSLVSAPEHTGPITLPERFFTWPRFPHFCLLWLNSYTFTPLAPGTFDGQAERLARCEGLRSLHTLCLDATGLGPAGAAHLARACFSPGLRTLELSLERFGVEGLEALTRAPALASLKHLRLEDCIVEEPERALLALAQARFAGQLEQLSLGNNQLSASLITPLLDSPLAARLSRLSLGSIDEERRNQLGDDGAIAIAESPALGLLEALDLTANGITDDGAIALAESSHLRSLASLNLSENDIGEEGRAALQARFGAEVTL